MAELDTMDLLNLPIGEQHFANDPNPHMLAAREKHPWLAKSDFGYIITEYQACDDILRLDKNLKTPAAHVVQIMGGEGTNWARFEYECLIARDGSTHDRVRAAVSSAFSPRTVATYLERIQEVVSDLLDEWEPLGHFDFGEFASRFPVAVMFGILGIPRERIDDVKQWLEMLGQSFSLDRSIFPQVDESFNRLWDFAETLIEQRKQAGASVEEDLLYHLVEAETNESITATELRDLILFLFAAGYDTSKNQLGHIINFLVDRPELWQRCAEDRKFCDDVVDETLRHSGVATSYRNVASTFEYRGVTFPEGVMLIFPLGIVCRYSGPFENPLELQPGRDNARRHMAFGRGMHLCLGQFLARLQIAEGLHMITGRLKNPRRDGDMVWRLFPGVWGPLVLPIAFDTNLSASG